MTEDDESQICSYAQAAMHAVNLHAPKHCLFSLHPPLGVRNIAIRVSVCPLAYLKNLRPNFTKFSTRVTYGYRSVIPGGHAMRYVLPVMWTTSCFT